MWYAMPTFLLMSSTRGYETELGRLDWTVSLTAFPRRRQPEVSINTPLTTHCLEPNTQLSQEQASIDLCVRDRTECRTASALQNLV